jgi:hypothetical protein
MDRYGASDEVDVIRRIGIDRCAGYIGIPQTVGWEGYKSIQTGELANGHSTAGSGLRKCATAKQNHCADGEDEPSIQMVFHWVSFTGCSSSDLELMFAFPLGSQE